MTNNGTSGTGRVRNLQAIFENKPSEDRPASPPSRGRSPALSEASVNSRAVSKVRASFVVVERPEDIGEGQQWGLRKASDVTKMADSKQDMTNGSAANGVHPTSGSHPQLNGTQSDAKPQPQQSAAGESTEGGLGNVLKGSEFEASSPESTSKPNRDGEGKPEDSPSSQKESTGATAMNGKSTSETPSKSIGSRIKDAVTSNHNQPPPRTKLNATKDAKPIKPPPTRQVPPGKPLAKSPVSPKAPKGPTSPKIEKPMIRSSAAKPAAVSESAKKATSAEQGKKPSTLATGTRRVSSATHSSVTSHQGPPSPKTSRFSKEAKSASPAAKPKSAPVPASAAAPTAASAAKSGNPTNLARKPTVTRRDAPQAKTTTGTATLAKKSSRASLPAQTNGTDTGKSRPSTAKKAPDEGFLARMMRPTASSAQKAHEKVVPNSPPPKKREQAAKAKSRSSLARSDEDKENSHRGGQEGRPSSSAAEARQIELTGNDKARSQPLNDITPAVEPEEVHVQSNAETQPLNDITPAVEPEEVHVQSNAETQPLTDITTDLEPEARNAESKREIESLGDSNRPVEHEEVATESKNEAVEVSNV